MEKAFKTTDANQQPEDFPYPIHIIGAGSVGSHIVLMLAKLGFPDITVYDFDIVNSHNVKNQVYGIGDVGLKKVNALCNFIVLNTGIKIKTIDYKFTDEPLFGIVFLAVDSMNTRKQIWENAIRKKINVRLLIEIRMSKESGTVFTIRPNDKTEVSRYEKSYYDDSEVFTEKACEMRGTAPIASSIANHAVLQLLNFMSFRDFPNEVIMVMPQHFSETHTYKTRKEKKHGTG